MNDFCKKLDLDIQLFDEVKGESESLGGLLLELNSNLPKNGTVIKFDNFEFTIMAVDTRKIKKVKVVLDGPIDKNVPDQFDWFPKAFIHLNYKIDLIFRSLGSFISFFFVVLKLAILDLYT